MQVQLRSTLEAEKSNFLIAMCNFLDTLEFDNNKMPNILKHLLIMSYNSTSYRRALSDIDILFDKGFLSKKMSRSTLNRYSNMPNMITILERLIQVSAMFYKEESTLIVDSTWFGEKMYVGGCKTVHNNKQGLYNTRKIHVGILKDSKIICYAKATKGTSHDSPVFKDIIKQSIYGTKIGLSRF